MGYKNLSCKYGVKDGIIYVDNAFSFTLPSINKTCVAKGRTLWVEETLTPFSMNYTLTVGKKKVLHFDWICKLLEWDTSYMKNIDRSVYLSDTIKKKTKDWNKMDVKAVIDVFDEFNKIIKSLLAVYVRKPKSKKK